jgi:hypothetical protein
MSDDTQQDLPVRRPGGVTFVVVLVWIAAIGDLMLGALLLLASFSTSVKNDASIDVSLLRYYSLALLIAGLITAWVASALGGRSQFARALVIIIMTLHIASALWALIAIRGFTLWSALFDLLFSLFIIGLLTSRQASDYYRGRT